MSSHPISRKALCTALLALALAACQTAAPPETVAPTDTATPSPSPTRTPTLTPTLTATPANTPTPTESRALKTTLSVWVEDAPLKVAFIYTNDEIALASPNGVAVRTIHFGGFTPLDVGWSSDGCELIVRMTNGQQIRLVGLDLSGTLQQTCFVAGRNQADEWLTWPSLSPTGEWVAYAVWSGDMYYADAEYQDVEVLQLEGQEAPIRLTDRGGAWSQGAAWSPDGSRLAYGDYDASGVAQIYHSLPDGSDKIQITHFSTQNSRVGPIRWSPDGKKLAFVRFINYRAEGMQYELWAASSDGEGLTEMDIDPTYVIVSDLFWWSEDGRILFANAGRNKSPNALYWLDSRTGEAIRTIHEDDPNVPGRSFYFPFPMDGTRTIGLITNRFYLYLFSDNVFELWTDWRDLQKDQNSGLMSISVFKSGIVDLSECLPK